MTSVRPEVSVLVPVFQPNPVYLRQTLDSVLGQTVRHWELVIVEAPADAPGADTMAGLADPRIRYVRTTARTSVARDLNQGLSECRAEFVARLDADDVAHPTRLERQLEFLCARPDVAVVGTQLRVIGPDGAHVGYRRYPCADRDIKVAFRRYNAMAHPSVMFRKSVIERVGGYRDDTAVEDYELWSRLAQSGATFANLDSPLVDFRVHHASITVANFRAILRGTLAVKRRYWLAHMTLRDRARYCGERLALALPAPLFARLARLGQVRQIRRSAG